MLLKKFLAAIFTVRSRIFCGSPLHRSLSCVATVACAIRLDGVPFCWGSFGFFAGLIPSNALHVNSGWGGPCFAQKDSFYCLGDVGTLNVTGGYTSPAPGDAYTCAIRLSDGNGICFVSPESAGTDLSQLHPPRILVGGLAPVGSYRLGAGPISPCPLGASSAFAGATNELCSGACLPVRIHLPNLVLERVENFAGDLWHGPVIALQRHLPSQILLPCSQLGASALPTR